MTAYVDESLRVSHAGLYLLAAAVVAGDDADDARRALRRVLLPGQLRFHWRLERGGQRARMLAAVAKIRPAVLAYSCRPMPRRQERARALCVNSLVWDLHERDIKHAVFESRGEHGDRRDAATIEQARRAKWAAAAVTYGFDRADDEPLLWIADALAGAISAHLAEGDATYLEELPEGLVTLREVGP